MSNQSSRGGTPAPPSRRNRREATRRDRRLAAARTAPRPFWQSPIALLSFAGVAVGLVLVLVASGVLFGRNGAGNAGELLVPIRPAPPELIDPADPRALGDPDAPVTIEVWSDFQCPFCSRVVPTMKQIEDTYAKDVRIMFRHILPNTLSPVLVIATVQVAGAIMSEAALSFLGLGMPVTRPSLGSLIKTGFEYIFSGAWWITAFPGVLLVVLILVINLLGDWLRDFLNPKLYKKG